jgi:L-lactate dehydrogenase
MDLQHAGNFLPAKIVAASTDYHETAGSDVIIITAGVRQREGESRYVMEKSSIVVLRTHYSSFCKELISSEAR